MTMNRTITYLILALLLSTQFTLSEVETAIESIEHSRGTHVVWRGRIMGEQTVRNETSFQEWMDDHRYVGSIEHHEEVIAKYDQVLSILYRLRDLLNYGDLSKWTVRLPLSP